eukprot:766169-Hanusia_phi.AAC.3
MSDLCCFERNRKKSMKKSKKQKKKKKTGEEEMDEDNEDSSAAALHLPRGKAPGTEPGKLFPSGELSRFLEPLAIDCE